MKKYQEDISLDLYRNYGISEWYEKCQILTSQEQVAVLTDLKEGISSDIVALVKKPFPKFVEEYFQRYPDYETYFKDPTDAYKVYFFDSRTMKFFTEMIRNPKLSDKAIKELLNIVNIKECKEKIFEILRTPYDDLNCATSIAEMSKTQRIKFAYLTQYIDFEESRRLGLSISRYMCEQEMNNETYREHFIYGLEAKLSMLNPVQRIIIVLYLGLYGHDRTSIKNIAETLNVSNESVKKSVNKLFPLFSVPLSLFRRSIGFDPKKQNPHNKFVYDNEEFSRLDMSLELANAFNSLSDTTKLLLSAYPREISTAYLVAKFLYRQEDILAKMLDISIKEAQTRLEEVERIQIQ